MYNDVMKLKSLVMLCAAMCGFGASAASAQVPEAFLQHMEKAGQIRDIEFECSMSRLSVNNEVGLSLKFYVQHIPALGLFRERCILADDEAYMNTTPDMLMPLVYLASTTDTKIWLKIGDVVGVLPDLSLWQHYLSPAEQLKAFTAEAHSILDGGYVRTDGMMFHVWYVRLGAPLTYRWDSYYFLGEPSEDIPHGWATLWVDVDTGLLHKWVTMQGGQLSTVTWDNIKMNPGLTEEQLRSGFDAVPHEELSVDDIMNIRETFLKDAVETWHEKQETAYLQRIREIREQPMAVRLLEDNMFLANHLKNPDAPDASPEHLAEAVHIYDAILQSGADTLDGETRARLMWNAMDALALQLAMGDAAARDTAASQLNQYAGQLRALELEDEALRDALHLMAQKWETQKEAGQPELFYSQLGDVREAIWVWATANQKWDWVY